MTFRARRPGEKRFLLKGGRYQNMTQEDNETCPHQLSSAACSLVMDEGRTRKQRVEEPRRCPGSMSSQLAWAATGLGWFWS